MADIRNILDGTIPVTATGIEVTLDPTDLFGGVKNTATTPVYLAFDKELVDLDPSVSVQQGRLTLGQNGVAFFPLTAKKFVAKTLSGSATLQTVTPGGANEAPGLGPTDNVVFNDITAATVTCPNGTISALGGDIKTGYHRTCSPDEGNVAYLLRSVIHQSKTLDLAASSSTSLGIPSNILILGVQLCVDTAVSDSAGNDTWNAELYDGAQVAVIVANASPAKNTKVRKLFSPILTDAATEIRFTPNGGNFTGGVIECLLYYEELGQMGDAP